MKWSQDYENFEVAIVEMKDLISRSVKKDTDFLYDNGVKETRV